MEGPGNHSVLFNSMIYPLTRTVVYGAIWYQGRDKSFVDGAVLYSMNPGESNAIHPANYSCLFAKLIQSWRQTWSERTNGITDIHFPFGFVQVSFFLAIMDKISISSALICKAYWMFL